MFLVSVLRYALFLLVPLSFLFTSYLYLYPVFHLCAFPSPEKNVRREYLSTLRQHTPFPSSQGTKVAPFRLLTFGDPQLEGDSSIEGIDGINLPHFHKFWKDLRNEDKKSPLQRLRSSLHELIDFYLDDIPKWLWVWRKRVDHFGNDYYLGHIYRTLHWWTNPTHVTVLGDLVGSQWIDDTEFESRAGRFWNRVFRGGVKVGEELAAQPSPDFDDPHMLGDDAEEWKKRIINVAGNHDIGYAGDLSQERMARFTRLFGKANYELRFHLPPIPHSCIVDADILDDVEETRPVPELRIIVLNDMNLDTPANSQELQDETYNFLNNAITSSHDVDRQGHFTILLTHIPMFKQAGICYDGPFFDFFDGEFGNGVKEQNHLSMDASRGFLEGIFGMSGNPNAAGQGYGRNGVVLVGHDHEGCDVYHYINQTDPPEREWKATRWNEALKTGLTEADEIPGVREITVRSMMGDFSGNAGLLSLWFDDQEWEWKFEFVNCPLGTQHIWWFVHILDLIAIGVGLAYGGMVAWEKYSLFVQPQSERKVSSVVKGKLTTLGEKREPPIEAGDRHEDGVMKVSGRLNVPAGTGKKLRKKRSKVAVKEESVNGSASSHTE